MMRSRIWAAATLCLGVASFVCLVCYYLALHDIFDDYASREVLQNLRVVSTEAIPEWTACVGEWRLLGMAFWPMLLFHAVFFVAFFQGRRHREGMSADESSRFDTPSPRE